MSRKATLQKMLKELKLNAFLENYEECIEDKVELEKILLKLCELEREKRYSAKVKRRIKEAGFPKIKTQSMLDYEKAPELPKQKVEGLFTTNFIAKKENVILVGDSGGGKTHLAISLGIEACLKDISVKFFTASALTNKLISQYKEGQIEKFMSKLRKYKLIIIDELGYVPFSKKGAELLFQVFSDRYEAGSIAVTSNLNFSEWTQVFIDKKMTTALLDRLTHNATIIKYNWGSIRFKQTLNEKGKKKKQRS